MKKIFIILMVTLICLFLFNSACFADGLIIPHNSPPLTLKYQYVTVDINNQVATVKVEQIFYNSSDSDLEGTYCFPLPKDASIASFSRWEVDHWVEAKVREKEEAEGIYLSGDSQTTGLALVEYGDENSFKTSVKPIFANSEVKIAFTYNQVLTYEEGQCHFSYPLNQSNILKDNLKDLTFRVNINSQMALTGVSSSSHNIYVEETDENNYIVIYEKENIIPDKDFELSYGVSPGDVGMNMITYREKDEGYFMLLLTPVIEELVKDIANRDIIFVIDHSGSMGNSNKMSQTRNAFKYCLTLLNERDNFNIVVFDHSAGVYKNELAPATEENIKEASEYIDAVYPAGGTNIYKALVKALDMFSDNKRPKVVVLLTDGLHNEGEFHYENISEMNKFNSRIFTLGVSYDVDVNLMEKVAKMNRGDYIEIRNNSSLEKELGDFYKKISKPVLTDLSLEFKGMSPVKTYPSLEALPDLFIGSQLIVTGKYEQSGKGEIILKGYLNEEVRAFTFKTKFPVKTNDTTAFLPRLWAEKRVENLLSQIRQNGERFEWKNEIISLGKEHNLLTPYTSMLIVDQNIARPEELPELASTNPNGNSLPDMSIDVYDNTPSNHGKVLSYSIDSESYNTPTIGSTSSYDHTVTQVNIDYDRQYTDYVHNNHVVTLGGHIEPMDGDSSSDSFGGSFTQTEDERGGSFSCEEFGLIPSTRKRNYSLVLGVPFVCALMGLLIYRRYYRKSE